MFRVGNWENIENHEDENKNHPEGNHDQYLGIFPKVFFSMPLYIKTFYKIIMLNYT